MNNSPATAQHPPVPPDDPRRHLAVARPDGDQTLPHLGVVGDTYTILLTGDDTAGRYTLIDMHVPPGGGPPPHRHDFEEMFTVLEGEVELTFRGEHSVARAGETVNVPANPSLPGPSRPPSLTTQLERRSSRSPEHLPRNFAQNCCGPSAVPAVFVEVLCPACQPLPSSAPVIQAVAFVRAAGGAWDITCSAISATVEFRGGRGAVAAGQLLGRTTLPGLADAAIQLSPDQVADVGCRAGELCSSGEADRPFRLGRSPARGFGAVGMRP